MSAHLWVWEQELQSVFQPFLRLEDQEVLGAHITGRELRQEVLAEANSHVTTLGDLYAVEQRLRDVGKQLAHLVFVTHVLLRRIVTWALGIVQREAVMNGDADFVGVKVILDQKAHVVSGHHRQSAFSGQRHCGVQIVFFVRPTGTDQFEVIAVREVLLIELQALLHLRLVAAQQKLADVPLARAREQNQPFTVLNQPVAIDDRAGGAVTTLIGAGNQQRQVLVTFIIGGQHGELRQLIAQHFALHMKIRADDRFDPGAVRAAIKLHQTTQVGKVGNCQSRHG
ncbi:hypothetical protein D3C80_660310 [compost metagenome]